jgi:hypothetical protein
MPKKKPPKKDEIPQKERFVTAARSVGASETAAAFDRAFTRVVKPKKKRQGMAVS